MTEREYSPEIKARLKKLAQDELYQKRKPRADVAGKRFGRLTVQRAVGHGSHGRLLLLCHCDCGGAKILLQDSLRSGVKSCGCLEEELKPALKREKQFNKLLLKTIQKNRTAKPVETEAQNVREYSEPDDIDIKLTRTIITTVNLFDGKESKDE
jgi:hypothetical protein